MESASTLCTGLPSTPPAWLTCCMARSKARLRSAMVSGAPLKSSSSPIFMDAETSGSSGVAVTAGNCGDEQAGRHHEPDQVRNGWQETLSIRVLYRRK